MQNTAKNKHVIFLALTKGEKGYSEADFDGGNQYEI